MLRIVTNQKDSHTLLSLSGNISGVWVAELRKACETSLADGYLITLDLDDVRYADFAGLDLISALKSQNVRILRPTALVAELIASHEAQKGS